MSIGHVDNNGYTQHELPFADITLYENLLESLKSGSMDASFAQLETAGITTKDAEERVWRQTTYYKEEGVTTYPIRFSEYWENTRKPMYIRRLERIINGDADSYEQLMEIVRAEKKESRNRFRELLEKRRK